MTDLERLERQRAKARERKRRQRQRDLSEGLEQLNLLVHRNDKQAVIDFAAKLNKHREAKLCRQNQS